MTALKTSEQRGSVPQRLVAPQHSSTSDRQPAAGSLLCFMTQGLCIRAANRNRSNIPCKASQPAQASARTEGCMCLRRQDVHAFAASGPGAALHHFVTSSPALTLLPLGCCLGPILTLMRLHRRSLSPFPWLSPALPLY